jgi:hypothetical protein
VHLEQRAPCLAERALVVGEVRAVGGADLDQRAPAAREDLRDAERVADLDQLAARDDDLAPGGERREREHQRRGVVVGHQRAPPRRR